MIGLYLINRDALARYNRNNRNDTSLQKTVQIDKNSRSQLHFLSTFFTRTISLCSIHSCILILFEILLKRI